MRVAMVCPYSASRPGGVQGQAAGLARSLRRLGHEVAVLAPGDGRPHGPEAGGFDGLHLVGRPVGLRSNGSVAPVALSPGRRGGSTGWSAAGRPTWCTSTSRWPRCWATAAWSGARPRWSARTTARATAVGTGCWARRPGGPTAGSTSAVRCPRRRGTPRRPRRAAPTRCCSTAWSSTGSGPRPTRSNGRPCSSSAGTSRARGSTCCWRRSPTSRIRPCCGWPATGRTPMGCAVGSPSRRACAGWGC